MTGDAVGGSEPVSLKAACGEGRGSMHAPVIVFLVMVFATVFSGDSSFPCIWLSQHTTRRCPDQL